MLMWKGGEDGREDKNRERRAGREGGDKEGRTGRETKTMVLVGGEGRENANGRGDGEVARHRSILLGHDHALPSYHGSTGVPSLSGMAHFTIYLRGRSIDAPARLSAWIRLTGTVAGDRAEDAPSIVPCRMPAVPPRNPDMWARGC